MLLPGTVGVMNCLPIDGAHSSCHFVVVSRQDERSRGGGTNPQRRVLCAMIQGNGHLQVAGFGKSGFGR